MLVVVAALVGLYFAVLKPIIAKANPVKRTMKAVSKIADYKALDMNAKIKIDADGAQGHYLKICHLLLATKGDKKAKLVL